MVFRILTLLLLPVICLAQINSNGEKPRGELLSNEISPSEMKRNASFNLDELKVRWKKAALENCIGAPCSTITAPGAPIDVVATVGNGSVSVAFVAPTNNGGRTITGYTVTSNPAISPVSGTTSPISVTGLTNGTVYTFTVIATNEVGNSVASSASTAVIAFTCGTSTVSDIDNNVYNTVSIGTQCWTKENLKVSKYNDMTAIPLNNTYTSGTVSTVWQSLTTGAYTVYDNEASSGANATNYGYLYNWYAAAGIVTSGPTKNICLTGYHVPTDSDWNKLVKYIHSGADTTISGVQSTTAGTLLKKDDLLLWTPNTGTDDFFFSALPGGYRSGVGSFLDFRTSAAFWSATEGSLTNAWALILSSVDGDAYRNSTNKSLGFSVRCLRD